MRLTANIDIGLMIPHYLKSRITGERFARREWLSRAALAGGLASLAPAQPQTAQGILDSSERRKSPALSIRTVDGQTLEVLKQRGKVVLVDVMMTTCPGCKMASEGIQRLYQQLGSKGFLPVAVAIDQRAPNVLAFYRNVHGLTFPVGVASRQEVLSFLSHPANKPLMVPTLVLVDKRGSISATRVGWTGEQEIRLAVTKLLEEGT
jgi:peroxiredoxin